MVNLKANLFFLDDTQKNWVPQTLASLNTEEKIGQMFCPTSMILCATTKS